MEKKRFLATTLSAVMLVGSMGMVACAPDDGETSGPDYKYNIWSPEKMEIKVENFGLGPGNDWLYETVDRFAQAQMDVK